MDDKRFAVLLTDAQEVKILECDPQKEMFDIARDTIGCEWTEGRPVSSLRLRRLFRC